MGKMVVLPILFCLLACTTFGAAPGGVIRGKVRAVSGAGLANVSVELWRNGSKIAKTATTGEGGFSFTGLPPASYEVVVRHGNYQPAVEKVVLRPTSGRSQTKVVSVEITLKPTPLLPASFPRSLVFKLDAPFGARLAYEEALLRSKSEKTAEAVAKLKEAVKLFPDYFEAHLMLAVELSKLNQSQAAIVALEQARRINDRDDRIYRLFGMLMAQERKFAVAEYAFRQAIERDPAQAESYYFHGITLIEIALAEKDAATRRANLDKAERELRKALELSSQKMVRAYLYLARVYENRGQRPAAADALETYLKLQPDDKDAASIRKAIAKLRQ